MEGLPSWLSNVSSRMLAPVKFQGRFVVRRKIKPHLKTKQFQNVHYFKITAYF